MPDTQENVELYKPKMLRVADRWRDSYNPLVRLRVQDIAAWLYQYQLGIVSNLTYLYRYVERRDPTICALIARRTSAIKKLNWEIRTIDEKKIPEGYTIKDVEAQQKLLQEVYDRIDNIPEAIEFLALAQFRGYSHLEKHYDDNGELYHLEPVPQWNWARAGLLGAWAFNKRALQVYFDPDNPSWDLEPIEDQHFVIREVAHPILEALVLPWIRKSMNLKDWDANIETYGLPSVFIEVPDDAPCGPDGMLDPAYLAACQAVASDARGVLPKGCKIVTVTGGAGGDKGAGVFKEHIMYIDEQIVMAGTGGLLTMLAKSGSGTLAGAAHTDTFTELAQAEAGEVTSVFNSQIDEVEIREEFGDDVPILAWFELEAEENVDTTKIVDDVVNLKNAGLKVDTAQISDKTGYQLTEIPAAEMQQGGGKIAELAKAPQTVSNRAVAEVWGVLSNRARNDQKLLLQKAMAKLAPAQAETFKGLLDQFKREVLDGDEAALSNRWDAFQPKLPGLLKQMNTRPQTQKVFQAAFTTGFLSGVFSNK
jgi:phage gp29-like protein